VRRPSMEVQSAQRKTVEPARGGKWRVALVASVLIAGGGGVVIGPALLTQVKSSPTPPPSTESVAEKTPSIKQPPASSPAPSTDSSGARPQENLGGASDAGTQDAGGTPGVSASQPATPPTQAAPLQAGGQAPKPASSASGSVRPTPRVAKVSSPKSVAKGLLEFRVRPYATVFLSGKELGDTPMEPVELPAGNYTVKLVNKSIPKTVTQSVRVVNGETTVLRVNLLEE
jgi:serine/threonine-protein kinase